MLELANEDGKVFGKFLKNNKDGINNIDDPNSYNIKLNANFFPSVKELSSFSIL